MTNQNNYLQGAYILEMRDVFTASALANVNALTMGAPGWGKTAVQLDMAERMTRNGSSEDHFTFTRLDPTTPPEKIRGAYDPAKILESPPQFVLDRSGTPYQDGNRIAILDEVFRASDVAFDLFVDLLNRKDVSVDQQAVVWANANFVIQGSRIEALKDRFALWLWIRPETINIEMLTDTFLSSLDEELQVPGTIPDWSAIQEVRKMRPGKKTKKALTEYFTFVSELISGEGFNLHPRRLHQWSNIAYRVGSYEYGESDWGIVPQQVGRVLHYAWPVESAKDAAKWRSILSDIVDPLGSTIDTIMAEAKKQLQAIQAKNTTQGRTAALGDFGNVLRDATAALEQYCGNDSRADEAVSMIQAMFAAAVRGDDIKDMKW